MMEKILKEKRIRVTDFRLSVLAVFLNNNNAISTEIIESSIGDHDRITLYRTLKTFIQKGLIHEINLPGESKRMALCDSKCDGETHNHQHMHFQCHQCSKVFCLPINNQQYSPPEGYQIDYYEIVASGICKSCS